MTHHRTRGGRSAHPAAAPPPSPRSCSPSPSPLVAGTTRAARAARRPAPRARARWRRRRHEAQSRLQPFETAPTKILATEPLDGKPPTGKKLVMLGTEDPNNQKLQNSLKELSALVGWDYSVVSYDPANPATLNAAIDSALTQDADYVAEAGIPPTPADAHEGGGRGREVGPDVRAPGRGQAPDHRRHERLRERRADGQGPRGLVHRRLRGQGQRGHRARAGVPDPRRLHRRLPGGGQGALPGLQGEDPEHHDPRPDRRQGAQHHGVGAALEPGRRRTSGSTSARSRPASTPRSPPPGLGRQGQDHRRGRRRGVHRGPEVGQARGVDRVTTPSTRRTG